MHTQRLEYSVIGNGMLSALLDKTASIVWCCYPDPASNPVFSSLMDNNNQQLGLFAIDLQEQEQQQQAYLPCGAIVRTVKTNTTGNILEIIDFCPAPNTEFYGKGFIRLITPLQQPVSIRLRCTPTIGWTRQPLIKQNNTENTTASFSISPSEAIHLHATFPISFIEEQSFFSLKEPIAIYFGDALPNRNKVFSLEAAKKCLEETISYWEKWGKTLQLPDINENIKAQTLRLAASTLKLAQYSPSGAIMAAQTTSIPEARGSDRNWDYRFCWIRDSFFVLRALAAAGDLESTRQYLRWLTRALEKCEKDNFFYPLFDIDLKERTEEKEITSLAGFLQHHPIRIGNAAVTQQQNDFYGSVLLTIEPLFQAADTTDAEKIILYQLVKPLGEEAFRVYRENDAGLWEFRTFTGIFTYSALMCWVACDRLAKFAAALNHTQEAQEWQRKAAIIKDDIEKNSWREHLQSYVNAYEGDNCDASLFLMHQVGFCEADDPRFIGTVRYNMSTLLNGHHVWRYRHPDDFGAPENSFILCSFWLVEALCDIGEIQKAQEIFDAVLASRNSVGLLAEHIDLETEELWGNYPQSFTLAGMLSAAIRLAKAKKGALLLPGSPHAA